MREGSCSLRLLPGTLAMAACCELAVMLVLAKLPWRLPWMAEAVLDSLLLTLILGPLLGCYYGRRLLRVCQAIDSELTAMRRSHTELIACRSTTQVARVMTGVLVRDFNAWLARVWLRRPGDLCDRCALAAHCRERRECLHLIASSGAYTHLDGMHARVPLGAFKIGVIAQGTGKVISHDLARDPLIRDHQWVAANRLRTFIGVPLVHDGQTIGVMAMFSQHHLASHTLQMVEILAQAGTAAIANAELIESQQAARAAAETDARVDKLTGLPNRALLWERVRHAIERARRTPNYRFALMLLDFDGFKLVNDSLGHDTGDELLRQIAARLRENLRPTDSIACAAGGNTVARLGGDEFVVLLDGIRSAEDARAAAVRLLGRLEDPYQLGTHRVRATASIGIVFGDGSYERAEDMIRDADLAMYQAKSRGKACYVFFDSQMQEGVRRRLELENDLRAAVGTGQLVLAYQPIVSLADGTLEGAEGLIRWRHPTRGMVQPDEFIPIAEEAGLIEPLTMQVAQLACGQLARWQRAGAERVPRYVSINLSRRALASPELAAGLVRAVRRSGLRPGQLQLEVTESAVMTSPELAVRMLRAMREAGMRIALDDFGKGYSSLSCLHELPLDVLKIDRSFVAHLERGRQFLALTHAVVTLAQHLGMTCVAEGIERRDQVSLLVAIGCTCGQGYYFGPPVDGEQLLHRTCGIETPQVTADEPCPVA